MGFSHRNREVFAKEWVWPSFYFSSKVSFPSNFCLFLTSQCMSSLVSPCRYAVLFWAFLWSITYINISCTSSFEKRSTWDVLSVCVHLDVHLYSEPCTCQLQSWDSRRQKNSAGVSRGRWLMMFCSAVPGVRCYLLLSEQTLWSLVNTALLRARTCSWKTLSCAEGFGSKWQALELPPPSPKPFFHPHPPHGFQDFCLA